MISELRYSSSARTRGDKAGGGDGTVSEVIKSASIPALTLQLREIRHSIGVELPVSQPRGDAYAALQKNFEIPLR